MYLPEALDANFWRLQALGIVYNVRLVRADVTDLASMLSVAQRVRPYEVYHLAAQSHVGASFNSPLATLEITSNSTAVLLEALRLSGMKEARFYFAGSSEMFGNTVTNPRRKIESSPFCPRLPTRRLKCSVAT
ncbi:MAG: GDP-mannose 4,6-dehydratase [Thermoproteus sp.]